MLQLDYHRPEPKTLLASVALVGLPVFSGAIAVISFLGIELHEPFMDPDALLLVFICWVPVSVVVAAGVWCTIAYRRRLRWHIVLLAMLGFAVSLWWSVHTVGDYLTEPWNY